MGLRDCLNSAVAQGALTPAEASELADDFEARHAQLSHDMGDAAARAEAQAALEADLRAASAEKRRIADLTEAARLTLKNRILRNADEHGAFSTVKALLSHYGFRDDSSVRGRGEAIIALAHGKLAEVMKTFDRRGVLGRRANAAMTLDLVKALHGEATQDATAKRLAAALSGVFEDLRQRYNAAGGAIAKLDTFGLPHSHDRIKVKRMGRDAWKKLIGDRLDAAKMNDALTGKPISTARLDAALDHAYENIVSDGAAHLSPQMRPMGLGAIAKRRMDERFFVFKDAESWLDYHRQAGTGSVIEAVFHHVNAMAKDIAAMELLGPNPAAMVEWLKQVTSRELGRLEAGMPSLAKQGLLPDSQRKFAEAYIDALWAQLRGGAVVSTGLANFTAGVKNITTSATLGATGILAGATDPFIARAARKLAGLPVTQNFNAMISALSRQGRDQIAASGVIMEDFLHVVGDELRFAGQMGGAEWTRWLADRAVTWNGLQPLTKARKLVEARAWQHHIGELAKVKTDFGSLEPRIRQALEGFGIDRAVWDIWMKARDVHGFVTPMSIQQAGGPVTYIDLKLLPQADPRHLAETQALAHRAAAEKLAELVSSFSERAVPVGTPNARAYFTMATKRGTFPGELIDFFLQFKSFGLSFTTMQLEAMAAMASVKGGGKGVRTGAAYFAGLAVPLTLGGALYIQIRSMLDTRDPEDMTQASFWERALLTGGGLGLFGDFARATENRFGQSMLEALQGPGIAFLSDSFIAGREIVAGPEKMKAALPWLQRWTPVVSSHPVTRAAWRRVFLDNLAYADDPTSDRAFKRKIAAAKKSGSPYFLPPGVFTPAEGKAFQPRLPNLLNALGPYDPAFDPGK